MGKVSHELLPEPYRLSYSEHIQSDPYIVYGPITLDKFSLLIRRDYLPYSYMVVSRDGLPTKKTIFLKLWQKALCDRFVATGNLPRVSDELDINYEKCKDALRIPAVWAYYLDTLGRKCELDLDLSICYADVLKQFMRHKLSKGETKELARMIYDHLYGSRPNVVVPYRVKRADGKHRRGRYMEETEHKISIVEEHGENSKQADVSVSANSEAGQVGEGVLRDEGESGEAGSR